MVVPRYKHNIKRYYVRAWQSLRVVDALAGSGFRHLGGQYGQPRGRGAGLFLETAGERVIDVLQSERANGRTHQARGGRGENAVEERVVARHFVDALCARKSKTFDGVIITIRAKTHVSF